MAGIRLHRAGYTVSEELDWWIRGKFATGQLFEISFEDHNLVNRRHLVADEVPITYLGLWDGRVLQAEFQLGLWCKAPEPDVLPLLVRFVAELRGVRPVSIARPSPPVDVEAILAMHRGLQL